MAKNSKSAPKGFSIAAFVYAALLALGGLFLWMYFNPHVDDLAGKGVEFDTRVSEELVRAGLTDIDIASQSRVEKSDRHASWIEYYKEVLVPAEESQRQLAQALTMAAQRSGLTATETKQDHKLLVTSSYRGRRLYVISIVTKRSSATAPVPVTPKKKVAIVIDDVGGKADISAFLGLNVPVTLAIMPYERHSRDIAQHLTSLKMPYIMHLPMQPEAYPKIDPGKAALLLTMSEVEVRRKFIADLATVPGVIGVSNHMGSAYSADEEKMRQLLALVKEHSLFYLDSYTTPKSKAAQAQKALGLPKLRNDFFLDDIDEQPAISHQLQLLLAHVNRTGKGIAIGHIQKKHLVDALKDFIPQCKKEGIEFVYLNGMLE